MEQLDAAVNEVFTSTTAPSTRTVYIGAIARFVAWIWSHNQSSHLLAESFVAAAKEEGFNDAFVRLWLQRIPFQSPIRLDALTHQGFCRFLVAQRKGDGSDYSKSVLGTLRSGLVYLHTLCGVHLDTEFAARLAIFYKGIKYKVTRHRQDTNTRLTEGKEPFTFSLYRKLAKLMLQDEGRDSIFTRLFLVVSWNLMCRAANTEAIRLTHVTWKENALAVKFSQMKNGQEGDRPGGARHVYANPVIPEVRPILALAVYFAVFGISGNGKIFPGGNQYDRYTKALRRVMGQNGAISELSGAGLSPSDFGSHSARKGAATFASSCSTSGPSAASICLRAGWSLPSVQNTYVRYKVAGITGRPLRWRTRVRP